MGSIITTIIIGFFVVVGLLFALLIISDFISWLMGD